MEFGNQLEDKWPQIVKDLELPGGLLQQIENLDIDGKLQAVLEWLEQRQGDPEKVLAGAILRAMPGEKAHWEQDVQSALKKASTATSLSTVGTPSTGYHSQCGLEMSEGYSCSLESSGFSYERTLSYSKRGLITGPLSGTQEKKLSPWRCAQKQKPRLFSAVCCGSLLFTLIISLGIVGLFVSAFYQTDKSDTRLYSTGDTVVAETANGFWYGKFTVTQTVEERDNDHGIHLQDIPCKELQTHIRSEYYGNKTLIFSTDSHIHASMEYRYLLPGSTVHYNVCLVSSKPLDDSAVFFVFDSLSSYQSFINENDDGLRSSVFHQEVDVGANGQWKCSSVEYTAESWSYYFLCIKSSEGVSAQYTLSSNVKYLNWTDYMSTENDNSLCTITGSQSCDLTFGHGFFGSLQDYCLLVHVTPASAYAVQTTNIHVETKKRYSVLVLPAIVLAMGIAGLLLVLSFHCISCKRHFRSIASKRYI